MHTSCCQIYIRVSLSGWSLGLITHLLLVFRSRMRVDLARHFRRHTDKFTFTVPYYFSRTLRAQSCMNCCSKTAPHSAFYRQRSVRPFHLSAHSQKVTLYLTALANYNVSVCHYVIFIRSATQIYSFFSK
jgi:hypothetical protein